MHVKRVRTFWPDLLDVGQADDRCKHVDAVDYARVILELFGHKCRRSCAGLVDKVTADTRKIDELLYTRRLQDTRVANTRPLQDRCTCQSSGGQNHFLGRLYGVKSGQTPRHVAAWLRTKLNPNGSEIVAEDHFVHFMIG